MIALLSGLVACHHDHPNQTDGAPPKDTATTVPPKTTGDTGDTGVACVAAPSQGTGDFDARCEVEPNNPLRWRCSATTPDAGPVTLTLEGAPGDPVRVFHDAQAHKDHSLLAWGLVPTGAYHWTMAADDTGQKAEGDLHLCDLPAALTTLQIEVQAPDPSKVGVQGVMFSTACPAGHVVIADSQGRIVWYENVAEVLGEAPGPVNTMTFTEDQTILVELAKRSIVEFDLDGQKQMEADLGVDFDDLMHHEMYKKDGVIYAIGSHTAPELGVDTVIDGLFAFDQTGKIIDQFSEEGLYPYGVAAPWMIGGYWAGVFPNAIDFSHTNSVYIDGNDDIWLSFRHLHAFAKFQGGPGLPGFGTLQWTAVGSDTSPIWPETDFTLLGDDPHFTGQHDVHLSDDGTLLMLDNGLPLMGPSRGVRFAIDQDAHTLTELDSWSVGIGCPVQGSVRDLPNGDVLTDCAAAGLLQEFPPATATPDWRLQATCQGVFPVNIIRGIPVAL